MERIGSKTTGEPGICRQRVWARALLVLGLALSLVSCATPQHKPTVQSIAVLLSDESPAIRGVSREISRQADVPLEILQLAGGGAAQRDVVRRIQAGPHDTVIAVGLAAARAARSLSGKRVVFCQVFNYEHSGLVSASMKGVSALPSAREQFRVWRLLDPRIRRIGVITGPQTADLLADADQAARQYGMEIVRQTVSTDRETLYAFRRLLPRVQGVWIVPDNRVLSVGVLRDIMNLAVREGKQVLAFSHELLVLGALFSVESDPADIARQALMRARAIADDNGLQGEDVIPLTRANVRVSGVMLRRFGLMLPRELQGSLNAP